MRKPLGALGAALGLLLLIGGLTGCQTPNDAGTVAGAAGHLERSTLREGDVIRIAFPGAPTLDATQTIRPDGRIALSLVGEIQAAGQTAPELERELVRLYASQLVSKEVNVTVVSSVFPVFVSGAVLRPGRVTSDRSLTVLQAIMEAGGFDPLKANLKAVVVIRQEGGRALKYTVDVQSVLQGKSQESFFLKPSDSVYVPERFSLF